MPLLAPIFSGINATCFAYGMTGSGKTHTMLGDIYHSTTGEAGICTMAVEAIFQKVGVDTSFRVKLSYLEIYNERINDLLAFSSLTTSSTGLMVVDDPIKGVAVPELTEYEVHNSPELLKLILKGNERRTMAETSTNQFSSRSHALMQISVEHTIQSSLGNIISR